MKNNVNRELPDDVMSALDYKPYETTNIGNPDIQRVAPSVHVQTGDDKLVDSIEDVVKATVKDGMTISFHHHFRNGDFVFNKVMRVIIDAGIKNLTLAPSSLTGVMNDMVIEAIKAGTVTNITSSGMRGSLGDFVSHGNLKNPVIFRSHGDRARAIEHGDIKIDVAFLGVPNADKLGNANGMDGKAVFGSLGYALMDAQYANKVVLLTDNLMPYPNTPASIKQTQVDYVVQVDQVGDPDKIGSGATRFTKDPKELKIASTVNDVIVNSPYFKDGFSFQTGSGGAALAVTRYLRQAMIDNKIKASFALGGITKPTTDLLNEGLIDRVMDVQDFDKGAADSMHTNPKQQEIDASWYADPDNKGAMVDQLDVVILSALEIDTKFNVNVMTGSDGVIRGAVGGHQDAATAKLTIISAPLVRGRIATVVPDVTTVVTPGDSIDVLVTEYGIAINPKRKDLQESLGHLAGVPVYTIDELQKMAAAKVGTPKPLEFTDRTVALVEYRDGSVIDAIHEVKD
ncbi:MULTISPECIES: citrate lyase subunit alpha [Furfurilactobacillus]|uniref:Citrate lyase alpha chain n=2 Tax=Furfurilactobacillus TaxID=2767882 RepID=A0ABT6D9N8_9LACO|nr:citrate lyase subunit alpha [Furfurilactobacillus milii]QLE65536.1 Citrate lyase alpha chain [Furfurilactobacillus rossiae]MCF6161194.1 citrate lyase subunit alpha [Furfurilactobacillus milii]MCF6163551.1 citrate lyase subunit alpha [Furfurilactobacillus milii]MDF9913838.1 citrate lyase subunit alpha [Furfurilactobacillus milii]MYV06374.1 citrate lyase subunit alpha [Furfurilactobacillus milii]